MKKALTKVPGTFTLEDFHGAFTESLELYSKWIEIRSLLLNILPQMFQNVTVELSIDCLALEGKLSMHNTTDDRKNNEYALDSGNIGNCNNGSSSSDGSSSNCGRSNCSSSGRSSSDGNSSSSGGSSSSSSSSSSGGSNDVNNNRHQQQ
ncbi:osteocalcin 2-like [Octopus bimaculoides]|uniref:osteocalcin 2-like n=1 Tax=Octopus bimaculoides TaxID=37653 RepID=UPI00071D603E|nr:osteocalcin 2-like [Octopus bimaculoides]|eukprot:XP_014779383.1 PREDICTED: putative uncharacterized protein DDB_G0281733 [Octopus bimaculoides]